MKALDIVQSLKDKKGRHVKAVWVRAAKTIVGCPFLIMKRTEAWVRSGISYANLQDIRQGVEAGTREPVQSLPWGRWREGFVNYIIDHKDKEYIRLYPASFHNLGAKVEWMMDGKPADYSIIEQWLLSSEKRHEHDKPACFTLDAENVVSIVD